MLDIKPMREQHWPQVRAIYKEGIETGNATFETEPPDWHDWDAAHLPDCRLVGLQEGRVVAWAALSPVSRRLVYAGVVEVSIYVGQACRGQGIGGRMMQALVQEAEGAGIWTMQASIFPENKPSILLHQRFGFRVVGHRERIARHKGTWRDVVLMERRSQLAGSETGSDLAS
jgi:L-amino acid N-acyltransferase YncA